MHLPTAALALALAAPALAQRPVPLPPPPPGTTPIRAPAAPAPEGAQGLSEEEARACARESEVVERRLRLFRGQGLPADEVARRNAPAEKQLADCVAGLREELAIQGEIAARTPARATAEERARVDREVRLAHARTKPDEERRDSERRLLLEERARLERERLAPPAPEAPPPAPASEPEPGPRPAPPDLGRERGLSEAEARACRAELGVLEQRRRVLSGRRLQPDEARRSNAPHEQALTDCLARFRREERLGAEERQVLSDIAARTPVGASEVERDRVAREVRLAHARAKPREDRTAAERALVAEADVAEARHREAEARLRDPILLRRALSGLQCAHRARRDRARLELAEEERIAGLGGGDRQRAYFLRAELRRDEEVLRANGLELQAAGGALPCSDRFVARVSRCVDAQVDGRPLQECESEEMRLALAALVR